MIENKSINVLAARQEKEFRESKAATRLKVSDIVYVLNLLWMMWDSECEHWYRNSKLP